MGNKKTGGMAGKSSKLVTKKCGRGSFRCHPCNRFRNKCDRIRETDEGEDLMKKFSQMSEQQQKDFVEKNNDKPGSEIQKNMLTVVTEWENIRAQKNTGRIEGNWATETKMRRILKLSENNIASIKAYLHYHSAGDKEVASGNLVARSARKR